MAINAYVGLQGSGKTFEVVSSAILQAVADGRRVVTNIAGINELLIHEYLISKRQIKKEQLGKIIGISNDQINEAQFFPDEEKPELISIVQGGDLVAIDEAWRFWGVDCGKLSHEHMQFFRMHRHYLHPKTGVACDVVLMTQDITGLHRSVKNVIEFTFKMHKHKSLGFSKLYRVEIYEGWKLNTKTRIDDRQKKYDSKIFPLYQSYSGGTGTERAIDARQNIFASAKLWGTVVGLLLVLLVCGLIVWRYFDPTSDTKKVQRNQDQVSEVSGNDAAKILHVKRETAQSSSSYSEHWHVVGEFHSSENRWIVLSNQSGQLRLESPSLFSGNSSTYIADIDGEKVARWTGLEKQQAMPSVK